MKFYVEYDFRVSKKLLQFFLLVNPFRIGHIRQAYNSENYNFDKSLDFDENCYIGVFEVAKQYFEIQKRRFNTAFKNSKKA